MSQFCGRPLLLSLAAFVLQKSQPAKKEKKKKEDKKTEEDDGSRDLGMPAPEKKAPHPLAVMDKEAKSPFAGDTWKKARQEYSVFLSGWCWLDAFAENAGLCVVF